MPFLTSWVLPDLLVMASAPTSSRFCSHCPSGGQSWPPSSPLDLPITTSPTSVAVPSQSPLQTLPPPPLSCWDSWGLSQALFPSQLILGP